MITENENTNEGIMNIMEYLNKHVPDANSDRPIQIISGGDQLTCERQENAEEDRRGSPAQSRWSGLVPTFEDFHALGNYYQVGYLL